MTARVRWVRELYGESGFRRLKEALDPEHRTALESRILPHEWVSFELFVAVSTELDRIYGKGDLELCRELGRYAARANLPTLYRIFYTLGSPRFIIGRAPRVWDVHYSSGRLDVQLQEIEHGDSVRLRIIGFQTPHRAHCLSVIGWCEQSVELSGGTLVAPAEEVKCRTRGDDVCEIQASWRR